MKLYLAQHGEAVAKDVDPDRPLSARGQTDVARLAALLATCGVQVGRVLHSGKTRAVQTAEILAAALGSGALEGRDGIAPNDPVEPLVAVAGELQQDLMVVGHQPFMGKAVTALVAGRTEPPVVQFQPGGVACLGRQDDGSWALSWFVVPELLSASRD